MADLRRKVSLLEERMNPPETTPLDRAIQSFREWHEVGKTKGEPCPELAGVPCGPPTLAEDVRRARERCEKEHGMVFADD